MVHRFDQVPVSVATTVPCGLLDCITGLAGETETDSVGGGGLEINVA